MKTDKQTWPRRMKSAVAGAVSGWLGREIQLTDGDFWRGWLGNNFSGQRVTVHSTLQLSTAMACVRLLSEVISTLPFGLYEKDKNGTPVAVPAATVSQVHGGVMALDEPMAGELNRRIEIRHRQDLPLADAELSHEFGGQRRRWAKIEPVGAATYAGSVQIEEKVTHRIFLRRILGITTDHEIVHGEQVYRVRRSMAMNGAPRFTLLEVEEL